MTVGGDGREVDFRSSWRSLQRRIPRSSATRHPRGDCRGPEEGFYRRFPSSRRGIYSFTPLYSHTHRRWGRVGGRGRAADRARAVGAGVRDSSCTAGSCVRVRILPTLRQRCVIPLVGSHQPFQGTWHPEPVGNSYKSHDVVF